MIKICIICFVLITILAHGQNSLSISMPVIYSSVKVKDNWTPSTSPVYQEFLNGSATGYGANVTYSFTPFFMNPTKNLKVNVGVGYFNQRFDVKRPFNYSSPLFLVFYTDYYSYHCLNLLVGINYNYELRKFYLNCGLTYNWLSSFQQVYKLYTETKQINSLNMDLGNILALTLGVKKKLTGKFLIGFDVLIPLYTTWRHDKIFNDDPATFYQPHSSIGANISFTYLLKSRLDKQPQP